MSMFGLVALTGVVVNDSLIMVDFINRARGVHADVGRLAREAGAAPADRRGFETAGLALAVREAGVHRFRPILLTSLTTFFGLAPLMWNESLDAAFMVPMAVSLGLRGAVRDRHHPRPGADRVHDSRRRGPGGSGDPGASRRCGVRRVTGRVDSFVLSGRRGGDREQCGRCGIIAGWSRSSGRGLAALPA